MKTTKTRVVEGTVVSVNGNVVDFQTAAGGREVTVPAGFMFQMDGKDIGVADLKPGMKVKATVTETTTVTPVTVTDVRQAEVLDTTGGNLIVRGPKGIRKWSSKDIQEHNIKIYREGKEAQIGDFRKGDRVTAVIISQKPPETVSERSVRASATGAPEPAPAPAPARLRLRPRLPRLRRLSRLPLRLRPTKSFPRPRARFRWSVCSACCRSLPASP